MPKYSPLSEDKETVKELELTPEMELPLDQKLAFIQAQLGELRMMAWRSRVDILHANRLRKDANEVLRSRGENNLVEHRNSVRQFTGAIKTLTALQEELEAELGE